MRSQVIALLAALALAQPTLAATSLCIEEQSGGYNWRDGKWVPVTYTKDSYIVKEVQPGDPIGEECHARIASFGYATEVKPEDFFATASGCYVAYIVGAQPNSFDVVMCLEYYNSGTQTVVSCANEGTTRFEFEPNGEFMLHRTYSVRISRSTNAERDSLVLSIGKCSVIAP